MRDAGEADDEAADEVVEPLAESHPAWRTFEIDVQQLALEVDPRATVEHDVRRRGTLSDRVRQIDVLITGKVGLASEVEVAVECKRNTYGAVGIGVVDEFIGKCLDLGVDRGVLCAWGEFTVGARARAEGAVHPKVQLRDLSNSAHLQPWSDLAPEFLTVNCPVDGCWGELLLTDWTSEDGTVVRADRCGFCGSMAVECPDPDCSCITAIDVGTTQCYCCEIVFVADLVPGEPEIDSITAIRP